MLSNLSTFPDSIPDCPPLNIEAEEAVLGCILLDPSAMPRVKEILHPDAFYVPAHRILYQACLALEKESHPIDLMTVTDWLNNHNSLNEIGGTSKLVQLLDRTISAVNVDRYAIIVMDKFNRRNLIRTGNDIAKIAHNCTIPLPDVLEFSEDEIHAISTTYREVNSTTPVSSVVDTFMETLEKNHSSIYPTGFEELNDLIVGFEPKTLSIVAGRTSMGKSQIALQLALDHMIYHDQSVLFFSLEMSKDQLLTRLLSLISGHKQYIHSVQPLRRNRIKEHFSATTKGLVDHPDLLSPDELSNLWTLSGIVGSQPLFINDNRSISIEQVAVQCRKIAAIAPVDKPLGMVIIDYLQQFSGGSSADAFDAANRSYVIGDVVRQLYNLAHELNICIVALSQISRGVESRNDKRPMLSDLSQSGEIETKADNVILCYRDDYYHKDRAIPNVMELLVAKARHGRIGSANLYLDPVTGCFHNIEPSYSP